MSGVCYGLVPAFMHFRPLRAACFDFSSQDEDSHAGLDAVLQVAVHKAALWNQAAVDLLMPCPVLC